MDREESGKSPVNESANRITIFSPVFWVLYKVTLDRVLLLLFFLNTGRFYIESEGQLGTSVHLIEERSATGILFSICTTCEFYHNIYNLSLEARVRTCSSGANVKE